MFRHVSLREEGVRAAELSFRGIPESGSPAIVRFVALLIRTVLGRGQRGLWRKPGRLKFVPVYGCFSMFGAMAVRKIADARGDANRFACPGRTA